ncbi:protein tyrosine phosphatase [Rhizobium sp. Leaf384]|uniref:dual specificity protein phosphatase family protein n=1 Tax=unclassified Rhizobium TaxID=2613769 RepID=UPI000715472C|nr:MULTISPECIES: dual specificity protein phosphatase family protein [unclassified Rhizobium]KQS76301.1 protein tyrosine phosphatase [Rhizobium sp. Leaf384]KQS78430.1 protein tyrosine phosphatase [Rhizobium sp. Leaf383]
MWGCKKPSLAALLLTAFLPLTLVTAAHFGRILLTDNFHEVIPGQLYRSAQPSGADLSEYKSRYGIRTVINLRGEGSSAWYRDEVEAAAREGMVHIDFRMSAFKALTLEENYALIAILRDSPKPILIHCKSGADRTGLASVIYASQVAGEDAETAGRQLSIAYGHIAIPFLSSAFAMDESWEAFEATLNRPG